MKVMGRLLVVDDEESIRDILAQVLGYEGYEVITAGSGGEALHHYHEGPFDLVLLDVKMQGIDGLDTLAQLRDLDPDVRVVMISGHGSIGTAVQAVKDGAFDFLEKPLDSDRLLVTVQRALEHRRLVGENARLREGLAREYLAKYDTQIFTADTRTALCVEPRGGEARRARIEGGERFPNFAEGRPAMCKAAACNSGDFRRVRAFDDETFCRPPLDEPCLFEQAYPLAHR